MSKLYYIRVTKRSTGKYTGGNNLQPAVLEEQKAVISRIKRDPIIAAVHALLASHLDPSLKYHAKEHSEDVTAMAIALGASDQLDEHSLLLLGIAAAYHDAGFIEHRDDHEIVSAKLAEQAMEADGRFSNEDIRLIRQMILDTKLQSDGPTHKVRSRLSSWLIDADLANLGRSDFLTQTELLADELQMPMDLMLIESLTLMNRHEWQSPAGKATLGNQKDHNKSELIALLNNAPQDKKS